MSDILKRIGFIKLDSDSVVWRWNDIAIFELPDYKRKQLLEDIDQDIKNFKNHNQ